VTCCYAGLMAFRLVV